MGEREGGARILPLDYLDDGEEHWKTLDGGHATVRQWAGEVCLKYTSKKVHSLINHGVFRPALPIGACTSSEEKLINARSAIRQNRRRFLSMYTREVQRLDVWDPTMIHAADQYCGALIHSHQRPALIDERYWTVCYFNIHPV